LNQQRGAWKNADVVRQELLAEQPLGRSLVMLEKGSRSELRRARSGGVVNKRKLTSKRSNKPSNRDRPNNSRQWILFGEHFQPA